jgi:hypothetical protein
MHTLRPEGLFLRRVINGPSTSSGERCERGHVHHCGEFWEHYTN